MRRWWTRRRAGLIAVASLLLISAAYLLLFRLQRCGAPDPDLSIRGCTAVIEPGRETQGNLARAFFYRGIAYFRKGQYEYAIQDLDEAIRLDPNLTQAVYDRVTFVRAALARQTRAAAKATQMNPYLPPP